MCVWLCAKIKMAKLSFCLVSCVSLIESPHLNTGKFTLKEAIHRTPSQHHCHCHPFILILLPFASTMNTAEHRTCRPGQPPPPPPPRCAGEASPRGASRCGRWRSRRATRGSRSTSRRGAGRHPPRAARGPWPPWPRRASGTSRRPTSRASASVAALSSAGGTTTGGGGGGGAGGVWMRDTLGCAATGMSRVV